MKKATATPTATPIAPVDMRQADWGEIERVATLALIPGADIHNTFVHICRALVEMTAK